MWCITKIPFTTRFKKFEAYDGGLHRPPMLVKIIRWEPSLDAFIVKSIKGRIWYFTVEKLYIRKEKLWTAINIE